MMHKTAALIASSVLLLSACGGGSSGGDNPKDDPIVSPGGNVIPGGGSNVPGGGNNVPVVTPPSSSQPVFSLTGIVTLVEYDEVIEPEPAAVARAKPADNVFSLSGFTALFMGEDDTPSIQLPSASASNLLGVDADGNTVYPFNNIEPLLVNYSVLSPDEKSLYLSLTKAYIDGGYKL